LKHQHQYQQHQHLQQQHHDNSNTNNTNNQPIFPPPSAVAAWNAGAAARKAAGQPF
jgi:hypothetical protein